MVTGLRSVLALGAALAAAPPSLAGEVRDVVSLPGGAIWIALDETPSALSIDAAAGRLTVTVEGWRAAPRAIEPYGATGFSRLQVTDTGFELSGPFASAAAERREGGVLVQLDAPVAAADRPAPNPAAAQADGPALNPAPAASTPADPPAPLAPEAAPPETPVTPAPASTPAPEETAGAAAGRAPGAADAGASAAPCDAQTAALADAPWDLDLIVAQADCLVQAGERANAAGLYERVLAFQPEHFEAALGLARLRQQAGRHAEAAALFETAAGSALTDGQALAAQAAARRARDASN